VILEKSAAQIALSIALAMVVLATVQCVPPGKGAAEPTPSLAVEAPAAVLQLTEDPRTEVFYVSSFETEALGNPEQQVIEGFEAGHPDIRVTRSKYLASPSAYINWLRQFPYTTVMAIPADRATFESIDEALFLDIGDLFTETDLDDAYAGTFLDITQRGGKQYILPAFYGWFAVYYNVALFERCQVQPPGTWAEFLAVSERLLSSGVMPLVYSGGSQRIASLWFDYLDVRLNGPEFHESLIDGRERYDDPRVGKVFEQWATLADRGYIAEDSWDMGPAESVQYVLDGEAAMVLAESRGPDDELDFFTFPIVDPALPVGEIVYLYGYVIPANSPHKAQALEFLSYLGSLEAQTLLTENFAAKTGLVPIHQGVEQDVYTPDLRHAADSIMSAEHIGLPCFWTLDEGMTLPISAILRKILLGQEYTEEWTRLEATRQQLFDQ